MSFRSLVLRRLAVSLSAVLLVSACSEDGRKAPLSEIETVDIPVADVDNQTNQNIDSPTLNIPTTFQVSDGDLLTMVWNDEFDGAQLDPEVWFYETGDGSQYGFGQGNIPPGWGNNELEYYLPDNVQLVNGVLQITARRESAEGYNFTSGRINTQDRFAFKYGRIEASIKLPSGQGLWPAFWMLSQDSPYGGWAATGEIDVVEAVNLDGTGGNEIFHAIHFGGEESLGQNTSTSTTYTPSFDVTEDFHTYALEWDEFEMRWYVDGTLTMVENSWFSTAAAYPAPFDQPFHILFNLAVGGDFPGAPNGTTPSPATLEVDWVRVYSGEEPPVIPADPGTIPDVVLYASDPAVTVDLVFGVDYTNVDPFGSGSVFDDSFADDADFSPAYAVTTGNGYGAQIGQLGIYGFAAGFAAGYGTFDFKAKGLNGDLIRVKFLDDGAYLDINLTSSGYSTALGNGWYQVSVPIADFTGVATATGLLFETNNASPGPFTFLLTDVGFSGTAGGGGGGGTGVIPEDVIYATDPGETVDLVATITAFGTTSMFDGAYALDADFNPSFQAQSGNGYGLDNIVQLGFVDLAPGFASGYESFSFKIKSSDLPNNTIIVKLEQGGAYGDVVLTDTTVSTDLGNGWYQVVLPMSGFGNVDPAVGVLFEAVGPQNADGGAPFSFLATDIGFTNPTGGGGGTGVIPEDVIYATDPAEVIDLVATITAFGTTSMFDGAYALDADFNPSFQAQSGNGYGLDNIVQLGFVDLAPGFASGYGSFSFKIKSADLPNNTIIVKLEQGGAYGDVVLTDTSVSTDLGNGWYQVVLPMSGFGNIDPAVGVLFEAVGPQNADGGAPFSFLATDIGFSSTGGGGGGGDGNFVNGDFETGDFTGWTLTQVPNDRGSIALDSSGQGGRAGNVARLVAAGDAAGTNDVLISQVALAAGTVAPGDSINVSFDLYGSLTGAGGVVFVEVIFLNGAGQDEGGRNFVGPAAPYTPTTSWTPHSGTVIAGTAGNGSQWDVSGGVTLQLKAACGAIAGGCGVDASFDNVTFTIN